MGTARLGDYIKKLRLKKGLSLRELGKAADVDYSLLGKLERGEVAAPGPRYLDRLADVLGVETTDLLSRAGYLPHGQRYLRVSDDLPPEAIAELQATLDRVNAEYLRDKDGAA